MLHNFFISVRCSTCFRQFFRPSSGAQNGTYCVRYWSDKYLTLYVQFWAPDDGQKTCLKHVQHLTEIKKLWKLHLVDCTLQNYWQCFITYCYGACSHFGDTKMWNSKEKEYNVIYETSYCTSTSKMLLLLRVFLSLTSVPFFVSLYLKYWWIHQMNI